jgi:hypothetical protein
MHYIVRFIMSIGRMGLKIKPKEKKWKING